MKDELKKFLTKKVKAIEVKTPKKSLNFYLK